MKSLILIGLAMLLITAILAPSIVTLTSLGDKTTVTTDYNEEEKKEANHEDFFVDLCFQAIGSQIGKKISIARCYIEVNYDTSLPVFIPPPRAIV